LKIVDPEGRELSAGQDGEVILKGPGVIREYVGTQPADAFIDGLCVPKTLFELMT
jgi:non-ribosomal peptide synthetase component E (peptide arylation enzyme)